MSVIFAAIPAVIYLSAGLPVTAGTLSIGTLVAFTALQAGLFRPLMGLLNVGRVADQLAGAVRAHLRVPGPAGRGRRPGRARSTSTRPVARPPAAARTSPSRYPGSDTAAVAGVNLDVPAGTHARAGRRDRLGQEHDRRADRPAATTRPPAGSPSTASTCATCAWPTWPRSSAWSARRPTCCTPRSGRTCATPSPDATDAEIERGRPRRADPRPDRRRCRTATTPWSARAATGSPAARSSASRSPARCCATRGSWCSTRRPARWTPRPSGPCSGPSTSWPRGRTTITIAHRLSTVRDADQIVGARPRPGPRVRHPRTPRRGRRAVRRAGRLICCRGFPIQITRDARTGGSCKRAGRAASPSRPAGRAAGLAGRHRSADRPRPGVAARQRDHRPADRPPFAAGPGGAFTGLFSFPGIAPGSVHDVAVGTGTELATLRVRALPAEVPADGFETFNVLLVSCFHRDEDKTGNAGRVVGRLPVKPDLTLLMGDQVYLDLPTLAGFQERGPAVAGRQVPDRLRPELDRGPGGTRRSCTPRRAPPSRTTTNTGTTHRIPARSSRTPGTTSAARTGGRWPARCSTRSSSARRAGSGC